MQSTRSDSISKLPDSSWILQATDLTKSYSQGSRWRQKSPIKALDKVNIALPRGKTVAIVGKSGSGKTTLALCLALLEDADAGNILFEGCKIHTLDRVQRRAMRQRVQIIFQHSIVALSPRLTATQLVEEPLKIQGHMSVRQQYCLVYQLLEQVGLPKALYTRRPNELSGGQCQRVAIARSLALKPSLLILDEPFVGLDAPIRNQVINLLLDLQELHKLTYLYISHDVKLTSYLADVVLTMDHGKLIAPEDMRAYSKS